MCNALPSCESETADPYCKTNLIMHMASHKPVNVAIDMTYLNQNQNNHINIVVIVTLAGLHAQMILEANQILTPYQLNYTHIEKI